ncbi:hypothetical protein MASR2M29_15990 [Spirochaetota bacterium]
MISFLGKFFAKNNEKASGLANLVPDSRVDADFGSLENSGFCQSEDERYSLRAENNSLILDLKKENLFAWSDARIPLLGDIIVEALICFACGTKNHDHGKNSRLPFLPKYSAGFLFKKVSDRSFLYCMVSSHGELRLDAVSNGEPRPILPWTDCPWLKKSFQDGSDSLLMGIILRGKSILVTINGKLAIEAEDDSMESGILAFAGQSYETPCSVGLESLSIDTRPMEVEADFMRYARILAADPEQRRLMAEGFFSLGYYIPALIQLKKIRDQKKNNAKDSFLEAECYIRLKLYEEAHKAIEECLLLDPAQPDAQEELYNLLYMKGAYLELAEKLEKDKKLLKTKPQLLNLLGHGYFGLGNWSKAAAYYEKAAKADPKMPIYLLNRAEALDKTGAAVEASSSYLEAALGFYEQEAWEDAALCSVKLREKGYDKAKLDSIDGMIAWARGDLAKADKILSRLWKRNKADAAAAYIYGLIASGQGKTETAIKAFGHAAKEEPQKAVYRFRLAEVLFAQKDPGYKSELETAIRLAPNDGWTLNLAGQAELYESRHEAAIKYFKKAVKQLPDEPAPCINLSHAFLMQEKHDSAIISLAEWPRTNAAAANQKGNILAKSGQTEEAIDMYRAAIKLSETDDPELYNYRVNLAAAFLSAGYPGEAETELKKALESRTDPEALALMGEIARVFGDAGRAELAYLAALELAPDNTSIRMRLAEHYIKRLSYDRAKQEADKIKAVDPESAAIIFKLLEEAKHGASKDVQHKLELAPKRPPQRPPQRPSSLPF